MANTKAQLLDEVSKNLFKIVFDGIEANGVLSGMLCSEKGAGADMSVDVALGKYRANYIVVEKTATTNVVITAADATYPRKDIIVGDSSGNITAVAGTPGTAYPTGATNNQAITPRMPDVPAGKTLIGVVWVDAAATAITEDNVNDWRCLLNPELGQLDYGLSFAATVTGIVGAPEFQCTLIGYGNHYFDNYVPWVVWDAAAGGAVPQGQLSSTALTNYTSATGNCVGATFANPLAVGDKLLMLHPALAALLNATYGLSALNTDLDAIISELARVPKSDSTVTWNATALASINAEVDTALNTIVPASPTAGSVNDILSKAAGGNTFVKADDSLEALGEKTATLIVDTPILKDYMNGVYFDSVLGTTGTGEDVGIPQNPSSVIASVITMCTARKTKVIYGSGSVTLGATMEGYTFIGLNKSFTINLGGQDVDTSHFRNCTLTGAQGGTGRIYITDGVIDGVTGFCADVNGISKITDSGFTPRSSSSSTLDMVSTVDIDFSSAYGTIEFSAITNAKIYINGGRGCYIAQNSTNANNLCLLGGLGGCFFISAASNTAGSFLACGDCIFYGGGGGATETDTTLYAQIGTVGGIVDDIKAVTSNMSTKNNAEGTHTSNAVESTIWENDTPTENWTMGKLSIDFTNQTAAETVVVRFYERQKSGGDPIKYYEMPYAGVQDPLLVVFKENMDNRWGWKATMQKTAGDAKDYGYGVAYQA